MPIKLPGKIFCVRKTFLNGAGNGTLLPGWAPSSRRFSFLLSHSLTNDLCMTELIKLCPVR